MSNLSRLLKESWTLVEEQQDKLASYFYARMFLNNPQLRDLFPVQMDVQRSRLLGAIVTAVQTVDDPDTFDEYLQSPRPGPPQVPRPARALRRHRRRADGGAAHVRRRRSWSLEFDQAWRDAYAVIAAKMIAGAEAD